MLALHKAEDLGASAALLTKKPQRYLGLEEFSGPVLECDTNSLAALQQTIAAHFPAEQIAGITTTSEFYLETVAELAASYGLSGNSAAAVRACRNKAQTRLTLEAAGVGQPRFRVVRTRADIAPALAAIPLPCVVKPADDTGSYFVRLCHSVEEVEEQTLRILDLATNVRGQQTAQTALIEEFIDAPEFSVETFTWQNETHCIGITEKRLTGLPYFVEYGHMFPANLPPQAAQEIRSTVRQALAAVGIASGPTHTEIKLTAAGCAIVEINARLAGGMIPELIRYATDADLLEQQLRVALGQPPLLPTATSGSAGIQFLVADREGVLERVRGVDTARTVEGVEQVTITARAGARVSPPRSAYDRLGYIIARGGDYAETSQRLQRATAQIDLVLSQ